MADFAPTHPGENFLTELLEPMGISQYRIAKAIDVPPRRINEIVHGLRGISADTALRLAHYFRTTPLFWLNLQMRYDLQAEEDRIGAQIRRLKVRRPGINA